MSYTDASRALCDALSASAAASALRAYQHFLLIARGSRSFFRLLIRTVSSLPGDVLAASIVINLLGLALPLGILQVYDRIVPHTATATLAVLSIGICCALLMETILRIVRSRVIAWSAMKLAWKTSVDAATRIATAPAELVDAQPAARWIQRLQAVATISDFNISPAPLVLIDLVFVVVFFALLVASSGWLAAVPLAIFILFGVAAIERGRELRDITAERQVAETKIRDFLVEALNGIVTVKALGTEQQILRRFERLSEHAARCTYSIVRLADDAQSFGSMVSILTQMATATIGAILAINGQISIGVVACSTMLAGRVIQPLLRLVSAWNEIQGVMVAEEIAKPIFDLPKSEHPAARSHTRVHQAARVVFDNVCFAHAAEGEPVLTGASLDVTPGEIIAITGKDSIGKSTVRRLAAGQLSPSSGRVLINGRAATVQARQHGSVVVVDHQNATVRGSVLDNLTLFGDADQLQTARAAARAIGLEADINRLPRGYDTRLGEAVTEALPAGLLQRIAIARSITSRPRLLVLDEANSSLDYASEQALGDGLASFRHETTILLITNRPSFAAIADRIFTLVDGKFCELDKATMHIKPAIDTAGAA
jgi:ATP-binding cassette, subfamily C, bacterial LapB